MISLKSMVLTMAHSRDIRVRLLSLSCAIVDRNRDLMKDHFEKERSPDAFVTGKVRYILKAMSTFGKTF